MHKLRRLSLLAAFSVLNVYSFAQQMNLNREEPSDFMRSNGKIYVVLAVVVTIVAGIFIYLFSLDRKMSRLEKEQKNKKE